MTPVQGFEILRENHAGAMLLKDGNTINYGVIRILNDSLVHFTAKGLREMWNAIRTPGENGLAVELNKVVEAPEGEEKLIASGHIAVTPLNQIVRVIF